VRRVLEHLLKLVYSPAPGPRYEWMGSILEARQMLEDKMTATLRQDVETELPRLYRNARRTAQLGLRAHGEGDSAGALPITSPYTLDDVLRVEWYPEPAKIDSASEVPE
jgi:hypothetical protein